MKCTALLILLVSAVMTLAVFGFSVIAGEGLSCSCEVHEAQPDLTALFGQILEINDKLPVQDFDGTKPLIVRHGFGGMRFEEYASLGVEELCTMVAEFWQFRLYINEQQIQPTRLILFPLVLGSTEVSEPACTAWVFLWSFEFTADYFPEGIYLFTGEWSRGAFPNEGMCPELLATGTAREEESIESTQNTTVTILYQDW